MIIDSFKKRYLYKLLTNLVSFFISFVTAGIIPRALGVVIYGSFAYISNIFSQTITFLEFRTSTFYFVKLSQDSQNKKITSFYFLYCLLLFFVLLILSVSIINIQYIDSFIFGSYSFSKIIVFGIFLLTFLNWFSEILASSLDALGLTVSLEKFRMINRIMMALSIVSLYYLKYLNISTLVILQCSFGLILISILTFFLVKNYNFNNFKISIDEFNRYFKLFFNYSYPLLGYLVLQFIGNIFDRWYLQHSCGSYQQGIYSFSYTLMNFSYIFINSIQPLIIREFSIAVSEKNKSRISSLFIRFNTILFAITAFLCGFVIIEAPHIVILFGGTEYLASVNTLRILMIYPLISSFSLLNGAVIYTTEKTKLFFFIGLIFTPIGMILTFLFVNKSLINFGADGLAYKNIILDFISMIVILYINSRYLLFNFYKILLIFLYILVYMIIEYFINLLFSNFNLNILFSLFIKGIIYTGTIGIIFFFFPKVLGLSSDLPIMIKQKLYELYYKWIS